MLPEEKKKELLQTLKGKLPQGSMLTCQICTGKDFVVADGFMANMLFSEISITKVQGNFYPTIPIACKNCGCVNYYSLDILSQKKQ